MGNLFDGCKPSSPPLKRAIAAAALPMSEDASGALWPRQFVAHWPEAGSHNAHRALSAVLDEIGCALEACGGARPPSRPRSVPEMVAGTPRDGSPPFHGELGASKIWFCMTIVRLGRRLVSISKYWKSVTCPQSL
jgi:hypothetical protein